MPVHPPKYRLTEVLAAFTSRKRSRGVQVVRQVTGESPGQVLPPVGVHRRILYFFHGAVAAVVSHGFAKKRVVQPKDIDRAVERKKRFEANPAKHTYEEA